MKKIFIALAALATISACNKAEVVEAPQGDAIAFGDAFVDNATKAIYETANDIEGFKVWGSVNNVALYGEDGANVTRGNADLGAAWSCDVTRYWTPSSTFNFMAIANGEGIVPENGNGIPTTISYTLNGNDPADLIYGTATVETDEACVPSVDSGDDKDEIEIVSFTMQHLLSRVKVSFENQIEEDDYTYEISNVTLTTWDKGVYTFAPAEGVEPWARTGNNTAILKYVGIDELASEATHVAGAQLVIPGADATLAFTYKLQLNGTTIYTKDVTHTVSDLEQGHSYSLNVQLSAGNKIDFTLTSTGLDGWGTGSTQTI